MNDGFSVDVYLDRQRLNRNLYDKGQTYGYTPEEGFSGQLLMVRI